ncbi:hypothetical protein ACLOJK_009737 [Asimina triloba]
MDVLAHLDLGSHFSSFINPNKNLRKPLLLRWESEKREEKEMIMANLLGTTLPARPLFPFLSLFLLASPQRQQAMFPLMIVLSALRRQCEILPDGRKHGGGPTTRAHG